MSKKGRPRKPAPMRMGLHHVEDIVAVYDADRRCNVYRVRAGIVTEEGRQDRSLMRYADVLTLDLQGVRALERACRRVTLERRRSARN
jgi:hypothetical protein